jgi:hypothetical protein
MNPVKDGIVKHPSKYMWSSYNDFASNRNISITTKELLIEIFDGEKNFIKQTLNFNVKDALWHFM